MLSDIIKSIKSEKHMSLNHWRYRILHWVFNEDPMITDGKVTCTSLPKFLYTHYCPLFHLTNLIVLLLPLILLAKLIKIIFCGFVIILGPPLSFVGKQFDNFMIIREERSSERRREKRQANKVNQFKNWLFYNGYLFNDFDEAFLKYKYEEYEYFFSDEQFEECRKFFDDNIECIKMDHKINEERKQKRAAQFATLINCSNILFKILLNVFYVFAGIIVAFLSYYIVKYLLIAIYYVVKFLFTINIVACLIITSKILLGVALLSAIVYLPYRLGFYEICSPKVRKLKIPFTIANDIRRSFFSYCTNCIEATLEFISMFYKDNCPPITIVEENLDEN